ncbi:hypothetical protein A3B57_03800 [Microgenomates group bacterium RIFCSPLOWO2_01_FULL_47_10]|nr:MAG: hypothetical protein A3B57_03800 [Microgenomates group bacterium RIFCSPLOWO2_01_FULL_47_10]
MKPFRFSPIKNPEELLEAIRHTHVECHKLCKQVLGEYLPVAGNIGIFCHFDDEFAYLTKLREELTDSTRNWNQKYYHLHKPIVIPAIDDIPETTYICLYIRKPDPEQPDVGDVDFFMEPERYQKLKASLLAGEKIAGASIFDRPDLDLVKLFDPNVDAQSFVGSNLMSEIVK